MLSRLACLLLALLVPSFALAVPWHIDAGTEVAVDVAWRGGTVAVRFPELSGTIDFDERAPERARATIAVSTRAATTGVALVDALVRSDGYLQTDQFPQMTFQLDRLVRRSSDSAEVTGRITMRGVTRPVVFAAKVIRYGPAAGDPGRFEAGFDLTATIDRTEFGSTGGLPDVAAVLPVRIRLLMSSQ
jgi:polyisoprenoid-binding protein YceI